MTYLVELEDPKACNVELTGGKGASLATLIQMGEEKGFNVPGGFVVTSKAQEKILFPARDLIRQVSEEGPESHEELSRIYSEILERLSEAEVCSTFTAVIALKMKGRGAVAVRSSATCEDSQGAAFAGQHATFLNIKSAKDVVRAIQKCFASFFAPEAVIYRRRIGVDGTGVEEGSASMAVVIQDMALCERSGVAFHLNPISGTLSETVINANFGLGESVVSGETEVDQYVYDRAGDSLLSSSVAEKTVQTLACAEGVKEASCLETTPCLSGDEVKRVSDLCDAVSTAYGYPQDIEWGFVGDNLILLQARPITRLPQRLTRDEAAERFPNPVTPMTWGLVEDGFHRSLRASFALMRLPDFEGKWFVEEGHYVYGNQTAVELYHRLASEGAFGFDLSGPSLASLKDRLAAIARFVDDWKVNLERYITEIAVLKTEGLDACSLREKWNHVEQVNGACAKFFEPNIAISLFHTGLTKALEQAVTLLLGEENCNRLVSDLKAGVETRTGHVNRQLMALAQMVRQEVQLKAQLQSLTFADKTCEHIVEEGAFASWPQFESALRSFSEDFGHREVDFDPYHAPWGEAPEILFAQILAMADADGPATEAPSESRERSFAARQELLHAAPPELQYVLNELCDLVRQFEALDDLEHYSTSRVTRPIRRALLSFGDELVKMGILPHARDIWMVRPEAVRDLLEQGESANWRVLKDEARKSRASFEAASQLEPPWQSGSAEPGASDEYGASILSGLPGSAGQAEGEVFVLESAADFGRFPKGAILVARTTNPAWTPLFYSAAAVITASGGPLSHGAVTAREIGIPAVMSVRSALARLSNGLRVRVDGTLGEVSLIGGT